jgi:hypothetical protein
VRLFRRPAISPKKLEPDETAVFQDEVDVHWNPKIGNCWMPRGKQTEVVTPGNNEKRHVAGSLHWRTGRLLASPPTKRRNRDLFIAHLDDLRVRLRGFRRIHVVCDNAAFHRSRAVERYLTKCVSDCRSTSCRSTRRRPIRSNESGGTSTKPSPATTAAKISTNCSARPKSGSETINTPSTPR